ncbi:hypothetical protein D9M73_147210 [compost metagenome]
MAFIALNVVVRAHRGLGIEAWVERRLGDFVLTLGRLHVGLGGFQVRVVFHHALLRFRQAGGYFATNRWRGFQLIGQAPYNGVEVRLGIGQIDFGGVEVVFRQCPASAGLVGIGVAAHAALGAQADLVVDPQVRLQVVLGQGHQFAVLEHLEINLGGAQGQILSRTLSVIGSRVDHAFGAIDFIGGVEPVKKHLPQAQFRLGVVENFGVVIAERPGIGVIAVPAPVSGVQIDRWIKAPFRDLHVFVSRQTAVHPRCQLRVGRDSALDRFGQ